LTPAAPAVERILEVEDLRIRFGRADAVKGISFHIDDGETLALVGESGSGKSATALAILQLLPYPFATHPSGSIRLAGEEVIGAPVAQLRRQRGAVASMIFQEPMTSLNPLHTIEAQIAEILKVHRGLDRAAARARVLELLRLVRLPEPEERLDAYPHQLSGGQRQRVMIAMALANEPRLLIADEPTTALDVTIQKGILELLRDLQRKLGMALLLISHDLGVVRAMADRVAVMRHGEIVEQGSVGQIFAAPAHPYTRALLAAEPKGPPPLPQDGPPILAARELTVAYPRSKGWFGKPELFTAVDRVSFAIGAGETLGVVGESGSGKTTLGLAVLRLLRSSGEILFDGVDLQRLDRRRLKPVRRYLQMVFQDPYGSLSPRMSLQQIVEEGLLVHEPGLSEAERTARVAGALAEVGLDPEFRHRFPHEFSGGQRQRISLARALVLRPKLIVLDEPTSALDRSVQVQIVDLLRDLQTRHGLAYLFISHDMNVVRAIATRVMVMQYGRVVEAGTAAEIFGQPREAYTRELLAAAFLRDDTGTPVLAAVRDS
jgi:microcin C transport system ATP-binding protein